MRVLILGGTSEAKHLAQRLIKSGPYQVIYSLSGALGPKAEEAFRRRLSPEENDTLVVRVGGFGGADGMARFLSQEQIDLLIDATHPFAETISRNAVTASQTTQVRLLRLTRPPWTASSPCIWTEARDSTHAAELLPSGRTIFLAVGRHTLSPFLNRDDCTLIARSIIEPENAMHREYITFVMAPPGESVDEEVKSLVGYNIECLVTKNSGADKAFYKIEAAEHLGIQVIMINRPPLPDCEEVTSVNIAVDLISAHNRP